jgi:LuxR family maltose regulon positive regulatory protein
MHQLSPKESLVLDLLAEGLQNNEIADRLGVSVNTVKTQLKQIYRKLEVSNRYQAMKFRLLKQTPKTQ